MNLSESAMRDLVPASLRQQWSRQGRYPNLSIFEAFLRHVESTPDRDAVVDNEGHTTYRQLHRAACTLANTLRQRNIGPGDVVAVQLANSWRACAVDLAVAAVGAVVLPFPPGRGSREMLSLLSRSNAVAAVVEAEDREYDYASILAELWPKLPALRTAFVNGTSRVNFEPLTPLIDRTGSDAFHGPPVDPDGPARILVTSGSESEPKMILYSHNALLGGRGTFMRAIAGGVDPMRNMLLTPLGTSFGSLGTTITIAHVGGTLILCGRFQAERVLRAITDHRPTHIFGVPAMLQMMLASPELPRTDTGSLIAVVTGGSTIDTTTIDSCMKSFRCRFVNLYGSADGVNCYNDLDDPIERLHTTVGKPNPAITTFRIVDDHGHDQVSPNIGEIWSRGPMTPMCYLNAPELNARYRTPDGWVRSGDLGYLDEDGYLHVVGRKKDVIIRGGRNISPVEVELVLGNHPDIAQLACIGVPDARLGERVCACVVLHPGRPALTLDAVRSFLTEQGLEREKHPEIIEILPALPISAAGKVAKKNLTDWMAVKAVAA